MGKGIKRVVGIGELLWDLFSSGKRLGGAPMNFCYHCRQLGAEAYPVSCVGGSESGLEIRARLSALQVDDSHVTTSADYPTGSVQVVLDGSGKPTFEICTDVAWDYIPMSGKLGTLAAKTDAACFGSLAQRNEASRATIRQFLRMMRPGTLKIFDVNLRQTFYSKAIIEDSLKLSTVLKLSDEELPVLAELFGLTGSAGEQLAMLLTRFELDLIAYTRGPDGSLLMAANAVSDHPGYPCKAVNSVGAGDSFTAALCMGLLNKKSLDDCNEHANRVAAFVCSQDGATPMLTKELTTGAIHA